jgi:hypothetical protein
MSASSESIIDIVNLKALKCMKYYGNGNEKNVYYYDEIQSDMLQYLISLNAKDLIEVLSNTENIKYDDCMPLNIDIFMNSESEEVCSWIVKNCIVDIYENDTLQEYAAECKEISHWKYKLANKWLGKIDSDTDDE